jgi:hypothetical protein
MLLSLDGRGEGEGERQRNQNAKCKIGKGLTEAGGWGIRYVDNTGRFAAV